MSQLTSREFKELDKLYKKSGFTKLTLQEQRRLEKLEGLSTHNKKAVEKVKWGEAKLTKGKSLHIQPKTVNQDLFLTSMRSNIITVGSGSAGTGKSYLSCYYAASELLTGNIEKIVITRPYVAVAGRTTGFKPNTDIEKLRGFVLPMLGYLSDVLGREFVENQIQSFDKVELAPLENIRGELPIGVRFHKGLNRYTAQISCFGKQVYLGSYSNTTDAFTAYKVAKEAYIRELADKYCDSIAENVYDALINYKVEMTD